MENILIENRKCIPLRKQIESILPTVSMSKKTKIKIKTKAKKQKQKTSHD